VAVSRDLVCCNAELSERRCNTYRPRERSPESGCEAWKAAQPESQLPVLREVVQEIQDEGHRDLQKALDRRICQSVGSLTY
jgi:hypothetical protein